eukprot:CAMPEP_0198318310 /NCGR_PEP_ID=MMETSP1450-20131203/7657_1 /TAXON_ID=753684 ORGANISM="Madagascaria erythrocladiodes, Strain CCMP3234" /NCGR_SAMPLE_ID=MMETSP1450 /ASSEMBLY_ACC=CAM_ASM_001115 /LENGTH=193 /DNA_ID=CAMNT_0044021599 /DNA_START=80 /DNA_END=658 /DNA_ORIENTATION=+
MDDTKVGAQGGHAVARVKRTPAMAMYDVHQRRWHGALSTTCAEPLGRLAACRAERSGDDLRYCRRYAAQTALCASRFVCPLRYEHVLTACAADARLAWLGAGSTACEVAVDNLDRCVNIRGGMRGYELAAVSQLQTPDTELLRQRRNYLYLRDLERRVAAGEHRDDPQLAAELQRLRAVTERRGAQQQQQQQQ